MADSQVSHQQIEQHPDYHQGFYDAQAGEPIWANECTAEYAAGWFAYWRVREALAERSNGND